MKYTFLGEFFRRFFTKSPKFFNILQWASAILAVICAFLWWILNKPFIHIFTPEIQKGIADTAVELIGYIATFFAAVLLPSTKAELMDDKTKANVVKEVIQNKPELIQAEALKQQIDLQVNPDTQA